MDGPDRQVQPNASDPVVADYASVLGMGPSAVARAERWGRLSLNWAGIGWSALPLWFIVVLFASARDVEAEWVGWPFLAWPLCNLLAVVYGLRAWLTMSRSARKTGQKGRAVAGTVLGVLCFLLMGGGWCLSIQSQHAGMNAKRYVCAANLQRIGQAMQKYAAQYGGKFPPDFETLVKAGMVTAAQMDCPSTGLDAGDIHACYRCIQGAGSHPDRKNVLSYEFDNHMGEGGNIVFSDMHHEWVEPYSRVLELVEQTHQRLAARAAQSAPSSAPAAM